MAKTKHTGSKGAQKHTLDPKNRQLLEAGATALHNAVLQSLLFSSTFDSDGTPRLSAANARRAIDMVISYMDSAAAELFSVDKESTYHRISQRTLERLYDCIDFAIVVSECLKNGAFPSARGITESPMHGTANILCQSLSNLFAPIKSYLPDLRNGTEVAEVAYG